MTRQLEILPEDFGRALAVVAHPDDLEYGAASAIARWTRNGTSVGYTMVTDGEAGIDGLDPAEAGPLRQKEQIASAAIVGVGAPTRPPMLSTSSITSTPGSPRCGRTRPTCAGSAGTSTRRPSSTP